MVLAIHIFGRVGFSVEKEATLSCVFLPGNRAVRNLDRIGESGIKALVADNWKKRWYGRALDYSLVGAGLTRLALFRLKR